MPSEFRQTSIALRGDRERGRRALLPLAVAGALLVLATLWLLLARVPVYAVSEAARLQAKDEIHPVDVPVAGRVLAVHLPVGAHVRKGDVLVTLDATDVNLQLDEARATARGLAAQIAAVEAEIAAREEAMATTRAHGRASLSEAQAARIASEAEAAFASRERERSDRLREAGVVADAEAERASSVMVQARAAVSARDHRLAVLDAEARRDLADRRAQNESLRRSLAELGVQRERVTVQVKRLEFEHARYTVRAPIDGLLGQVRAPQVGSVVAAGQTVAVVTPETALEIVADFAPANAIGRIRPGQRARMRVTGFPWTQYGMLDATVTALSSEPLEGRIQVKLALADRASSAIPRRHGLIGDVEIVLDEVSPVVLIARAVGETLEPSEPR